MSQLIEDLTAEDLIEIVRYHGANEVMDAVLAVAVAAGGEESAVVNVHRLLLRRAARLFAQEAEE